MKHVEIFSIVAIVLCLRGTTHGRVFTKCGLAAELGRQNFPRSFIGHWICLIEAESGKDTAKVVERGGGKYMGLFQLKSGEWCTDGKAGGKCNMKCENLLLDDITEASKCAKKMFNEIGFQGWPGWVRNCQGKIIPLPTC